MPLLQQAPKIVPPLDPVFRPAALGNRAFRQALRECGKAVLCRLALVRGKDSVSVFSTEVFPLGHPQAAENLSYVERILKFLLWQKGAWKVLVDGPKEIAEGLAGMYRKGGSREFDAVFSAKVYGKESFEVRWVAPADFPAEKENASAVGGHLKGCRIGFDAGGSDRKAAALVDGKEVFSCEVVWEPKVQSDWQYHVDGILDSIARAAAYLPRLDAIGVSSAGIFIENQARVASLFRKVPEESFEANIKDIYLNVGKKWGVPVEVANDGDVTALAGAMELKDHPVLGIAMGTSQAGGYVDSQGSITGWLNELAFVPVDYAAGAPLDSEWSGDRGTGVHYFSQEAAIRLAPAAGISLDKGLSPGGKLKEVQTLLEKGDPRPRAIFESIGVFLGYGLLHYADFYKLKHIMILGRVTSGQGGELILKKAREVLQAEDPGLAKTIQITLPDEASRRVGQAVAAASLPKA
jgi:predicted NBD/HSP70 family sugar kinase